MRKLAHAFSSLALAAGLFLSPALARAQVPTDYPNLKGTGERTGANGDPRNSSPGFLRIAGAAQTSSLQWFRTAGGTFDVAIDNTDDANPNQVDSSGNVVGPFDIQPNGIVTRFPPVANLSNRVTLPLSPANGWAVTNEDGEASFLYIPSRRTAPQGTLGRDFNPRFASYEFTNATPSAPGRDPRIAATPGDRRTFTWTLNSPDPTPRNVAVFAWLPIGQTIFNGVSRVQQRYFVYEVEYGNNQRYVDIVDTDAAGVGFIRLGGAGRPTDTVFPFNGINPIRVTLYNTIPRDENGNLRQTALDSSNLPRLVYADAVRFTNSTGSIYATPTAAGFGGTDRRVISARNDSGLLAQTTSNDIFARPVVTPRGIVTSHDYNTGLERWSYSPDDTAPENTVLDETAGAFTPSGGFVSANRRSPADPGNAATTYGPTYYRGAAITGTVLPGDNSAATESVIVDPGTTALAPDVTYEITTYVSGLDTTGVSNFARAAQYEIFEGATSAGIFTLDRGATRGFVRLGNRRYSHTVANPLRVQFYNTSPLASDATPVAREIMVDAVRFIGSQGNVINSTPVHATALVRRNNTDVNPLPTNVVLIADERGRISCLDAIGNGDGTTKVYWTYPSTPTVNGQDADGTPLYKDPNLNVGLGINDGSLQYDGVANQLLADLPKGFDLSTASIVRLDLAQGMGTIQRDFLIIGGTNGRVNCIAMEGRGDLTNDAPGTTYRRWSYPDTSPSPSATVSAFGRITSVTTGTIGATTRVYFGTELGRFFAINAVGFDNSQYGSFARSTAQVWQYPGPSTPVLGAIEGAPALDVANNRIFFGTLGEDNQPSHLLSLNATTGAVNWDASGGNLGSWRSGPAYVPSTELNNIDLVAANAIYSPAPDSLFAMNENGYVYAVRADTGALIWQTNELQSGGQGSLGYVRLLAQDRVGTTSLFPTITVPTEGGRFAALFARRGDETGFSSIGDQNGNRLAWGARVNSPIVASITTLGSPTGLDGFLYGASSDGTIYAFSGNTAGGGGGIGNPPIYEDVVDNNTDSAYVGFRNAEVGLLSREGFVRLRQTQAGTSKGNYNFAEVIDTTLPVPTALGRLKAAYKTLKSVPAFEWGETIYVILYNFPAPQTNSNGADIGPPVVEVTVTTEGKASRPILSEARVFKDRTGTENDAAYAVVQVPLTSGGNTSLVPGPGLISVSLRTSAANSNFVQQSITLRPDRTRVNYTVANPLAISMTDGADDAFQIGYTTLPQSGDNVNGSPNVTGGADLSFTGRRDTSLLGTTFGRIQHGQSGRVSIAVYDRSLMTLLRGDGRGLDNVRVDRRELEWQGFAASIAKPIVDSTQPAGQSVGRTAALFSPFEDLPTLLPNVSLDYPNIRNQRVTVTKDPKGATENPIFGPVALKGPRARSNPNDFITDAATARVLRATEFEFKLDVPRYQPPAFVPTAFQTLDSIGNALTQGYAGRYSIYVDSDGNGIFGGGREAYRSFNLFGGVAPDERLVVTTPTVDLGALAGGAGYEPSLGYGGAAPYRTMGNTTNPFLVSPWSGPYTKLFAPFTVLNEGNVNLLNVRLAKGTNNQNGDLFPWQAFSLLNDENSVWLDASLDVWSDLDRNFAPIWDTATGNNAVLGQKSRVTDLVGRPVQANPVSRFNPNLPGSGNALLAGREPRDPRIGVTIPIGFPMGPYSQVFRVIEDFRINVGTNNDESLSLGYAPNGQVDPDESYSDPGVRVNFSVTETQLTGGTSNLAPKMVDTGTNGLSGWSSRQPAAARALNGAVGMVFASNRPSWEPLIGTTPGGNTPYRLFISTLAGGAADAPRSRRSPDSQTRDLNKFLPSETGTNTDAGRWWNQEVAGYPNAAAATLFPALPGAAGNVAEGSQTFGFPALPVNGFSNPATFGTPGAAGYSAVTLAFVGNVNRQGPAGTLIDSRLFATAFGVAADGAATVGDPIAMPYDPTSRKGKPAVVESTASGTQGATIVYPVISGNASSLFVTRFQGGAFTQPIPIDLGTAFESAGEPSAAIRFSGNTPILEVAFAGRLRGRSGNEIFQMTLILDPATHLPVVPFRYIQYRVRGERATFDATNASYRVRGAYLREPFVDRDGTLPDETYDDVIFLRPDPAATDLRDPVTRKTDRESRVESSTSRTLGGQIYLDRGAGSIRSVGGVLPRTAEVMVNYDSYVIRLSGNEGNGYGSPTLMKDSRLAPSNSYGANAYWYQPNGSAALPGDTGTFADRTYVLFTRAAQPGGQTVRPFLATTRLGIRLDRPIATRTDGTLAETITIDDALGRYQLDPAAGKVYFTRADEGRTVRVTFNGVTRQETIAIVGERAEEALPLGRSVNENNVAAFFDPVFNLPGESFDRRALIWTFWSSTRNGAPNIFMGTISPKLVPFVPAQ